MQEFIKSKKSSKVQKFSFRRKYGLSDIVSSRCGGMDGREHQDVRRSNCSTRADFSCTRNVSRNTHRETSVRVRNSAAWVFERTAADCPWAVDFCPYPLKEATKSAFVLLKSMITLEIISFMASIVLYKYTGNVSWKLLSQLKVTV